MESLSTKSQLDMARNVHDMGSINKMREAIASGDETVLQEAAQQFEAIFVQMMLKEMRDTLPEGGLFDDESLRFYQDMMDKELSQTLVAGDGIGLSEVIERQLTFTPEADALRSTLNANPSVDPRAKDAANER